MDWEALEVAIREESWPRALELALEGWRKQRHAVLADLIDILASRTTFGPIAREIATTKTKAEPAAYKSGTPAQRAFQKSWLSRAKNATAVDLDPLLATLTRSLHMPDGQRQYATWHERLNALAALPDDPRAARTLFDIVRKAPWTTLYMEDPAVAYKPLLDALGRIADERLLLGMRSLHQHPVASRQNVRRYLTANVPLAVEEMEVRQLKQRPLDPTEIARCEQIMDRLGGRRRHPPTETASAEHERDEAALLDLVLQNLDDDGPREVIADYWLERGDPRGELIALDLKVTRHGTTNEADKKARRALLREHEKAWLGDLALVSNRRVWKRGFLDYLELRQNAVAEAPIWEAAALHPQLATVRSIGKGDANETHFRRFIFSPSARALRELTAVTKGMLRDVCARSEPWTTLEHLVLGFMPDKKILQTIDTATSLPRLMHLTVGVTEGNVDKLVALLRDTLKHTRLTCIAASPHRWYQERGALADWLAAVDTHLANVPLIKLWLGGDCFISARRSSTKGKLHVELVCDQLYGVKDVLPALENVDRLVLRALEGVDELAYPDADAARRLLANFPPNIIEMDPLWTSLVSKNAKAQGASKNQR